MSLGSILAVVVLAAVGAIIAFNVMAGGHELMRRFHNWRLTGYLRTSWGIRENAAGILLTAGMAILIVVVYAFT